MGMIRLVASVLITLVLLSPGLLAGGFENASIGVKAKGMGGAFRAIADDWSAAYYNPAGLAYINDNQLGVSSGFITFRNELTPNYYYYDDYGNTYDVGVFNDRTLYNRHATHALPSAGCAVRMPFWGETVFGLSAYQPFDNNLIWTVWESPLAYNDSIAGQLHTDQIESDIDVVAFQLTLAREFVEDQLSVGLGIQFFRADVLIKDLAFRENPLGSPLNDRPFDKIPELTKNDGNGYGFGFNLGFKYRLNDKTTMSSVIRVPFNITVSGTTELTFVMPKGSPYLPYNPGTIEYLFSHGGAVVPKADFEADLKLPASFGLGVAYDFSDRLTVALDAEYTNWSKFKGFEFSYSQFRSLPSTMAMTPAEDAIVTDFFTRDMTSPADWDNTIKVMLGASYQRSEALTLLGGVFMDQSPMSSSGVVTPLFVDPGNKIGITGGLLLDVDRWELGLATGYIHTSDDQSVSSLVDVDGDGIHDSFAAVYGASTYETTLSVNYRF
jgi:long-chain fatty acid transport protein